MVAKDYTPPTPSIRQQLDAVIAELEKRHNNNEANPHAQSTIKSVLDLLRGIK